MHVAPLPLIARSVLPLSISSSLAAIPHHPQRLCLPLASLSMANLMQDHPRGGSLPYIAYPDAGDGGSPAIAIASPLPILSPPSKPLPVSSKSHVASSIRSPPLAPPTAAPLSPSVPVRVRPRAAHWLLPRIITSTAPVPQAPHYPNHISPSDSGWDSPSPSTDTSASSPSPITPESPHPVLQRRGLIVLAMNDNNAWSVVDLSNASTGESIRELIYSALRIPDEDYDITSLYQGHITSGRIGDALSNEALLQMCERMGDSEGSLRFTLGKTSFPRSSAITPLYSKFSESPYLRTRSSDVQTQNHPAFDGLNGYEASDENTDQSSEAQAGYSSRHPRRDDSPLPNLDTSVRFPPRNEFRKPPPMSRPLLTSLQQSPLERTLATS
ncbi:hypothetical protein DL93DRAFT_1340158 [Clavulina sp. PMI_390]|nr:hypothetical protein DL93DRAFT_1340158 [Clavulina sp. PMI_390]